MGIQMYDPATDNFTPLAIREDNGEIFESNIVSFIERRNGEIWVSGNMLCRLNIKDYLLTVQKIDIPMTSTGFMIEDKKQNVWIAKDEEGVYRLDSNNQLTLYLSKDNGYVKSICEDSRGNIYVGSMRKGLFVYNKRQDSFIPIDFKEKRELPICFLYSKPLHDGSWDYIDPTVFIDDDGRAYLYWGNPNIYYAELNDDMISLKGEVGKLEQTVESFGAPNPEKRVKGVKYKDTYTEGPWLHKREGKYYLLYAAGGVPEHIAYSMSDGPLGPWKYMGEIMPLQDTGSFTNHCGVIDYKGNSYFFYHTGKLPGGGGFGRSAAVEQFKYNADGTFPIINATREGVSPVGTLNPYERVEAETIAFSEGVKSEPNVKTGIYISEIHNGDYIKVREVDFGNKSPKRFTATVASALRGGTLEVRTDSISGPLIAELTIPSTGGWECWKTLQTDIVKPVTGIQDIYFVFKGRKGCKLFNFDWYKFNR